MPLKLITITNYLKIKNMKKVTLFVAAVIVSGVMFAQNAEKKEMKKEEPKKEMKAEKKEVKTVTTEKKEVKTEKMEKKADAPKK